VFLPKLMQQAMKVDADAAIEAFGKNEQVKIVFWTRFISMAGLVLATGVDPVIAQQVVGMITGWEDDGRRSSPPSTDLRR
jgi:hypothetical protein